MSARLQSVSSHRGPIESCESAHGRFIETRRRSEGIAVPLTPEDQVIQSMPDVSPTKWHLAHTSWAVETFMLRPFLAESGKPYRTFETSYDYLFNSYYETVGTRHPRSERGLISRPGVEDVRAYRHHVDDATAAFITEAGNDDWPRILSVLDLCIHHEQQHQELMLTDIKHVFSCNPLRPVYVPFRPHEADKVGPMTWIKNKGGLVEIGHNENEFSFDNEKPRHKVFLNSFQISSRLVTNGEYLEFIRDGGYERPEFWLSCGWETVNEQGWKAPLYWQEDDGELSLMTLYGMQPLVTVEPVCHVSFYEADAYACWADKRLATEAEWEVVARDLPVKGNLAEGGHYHPLPLGQIGSEPAQFFGDVWEWTSSPYTPYPGFQPLTGVVGEYNGKFMSNQMVLRGGSCVTPPGHIRPTYRNFFYPDDRWQFSGIRLAEDTS